MAKKKFWVWTADHSGLPLATRLKEEGNDVTMVLIRPEERCGKWEAPKTPEEAKKNIERIKYLNKNGNGLIDKMWAEEAMGRIKRNDYVIWDQIWGFQFGDLLYKRGMKVLGGSKFGHTLETERQKTLQLFGKLGFDLPLSKHFGPHSSDKAIKFLDSMKDEKLFALKSDNVSVVTQVAEDSNDELIKKLQAEKKEIDKDGLLLQEKVSGIEYNLETYYCKGVPILCNIDIEEKRKYNYSSQCQVGCAYDLVWTLPVDHELRNLINKPLDQFAKKYIGTGRIDASVVHNVKEKKIYPLECCGDRWGFNQIYTLLELLTIDVGEWIADLMDGNYKDDIGEKLFKQEYGCSLRIFNDESTADSPMTYPDDLSKHYWLWDVYKKNGKLYTTGGLLGDSPGIITASANNPEGGFALIREYYSAFHLTTLWSRDDFQDDEDVNSPLYRFHQMKKLKLI